MGLETDFFVAADEQIDAAFPAWVRPKPKARRDGTWIPSRSFPDLKMSPNAIFKAEMAAVKKFPYVQFKDVDPVKLGLLHSILGGEEEDLGIADPPALLANPGEDDSPEEWMVALHAEFIEALANLTKAQLKTATKEWLESDELDGWKAKDAAPVVDALSDLAKKATKENKNVYLWMRL